MSKQIKIPLSRPSLVNFSEVEETLRRIWRSGRITMGPQVSELEKFFEKSCCVRNAVAVSSCTAGMMLVLSALGLRGRVIIPSFTWTATAHALIWNGLTPVFCDAEPDAYTIDPSQIEQFIDQDVSAIMAANVFGVPPAMDALVEIANRHDLKVIVDSAQGFGSSYRDQSSGGFGDAEIFSLSPTKGLTAGEGGMVTTNNDELADQIRSMRDYGKSGDGDVDFVGLSARMSEFHAAIGVHNSASAAKNQEMRNRLVELYRKNLSGNDAIRFQDIPADRHTCNTYFVIFIDENNPVDRNILHELLLARGIQTRKYFHPPIHLQAAYSSFRHLAEGKLPVSEKASREGLALPLFAKLSEQDVQTVCDAISDMV